MKRTLEGVIAAGEPLILQAIEAMRIYLQAEEEGRTAREVERLRVLADSLYLAVVDYQISSGDVMLH
ncbi:hypothetical protein WCE02_20230 [Pseudomonas juntendi]